MAVAGALKTIFSDDDPPDNDELSRIPDDTAVEAPSGVSLPRSLRSEQSDKPGSPEQSDKPGSPQQQSLPVASEPLSRGVDVSTRIPCESTYSTIVIG